MDRDKMDSQTTPNSILEFAEEHLSQAEHYSNEHYKTVRQSIAQFETNSKAAGYSDDSIDDARFFLCAYLDEIASWSHSLLNNFYHITLTSHENEFFERLERRRQDPQKHIDLLELAYLCFSLGFHGKYRNLSQDNGVIALMDSLYADIRHIRGDGSSHLSRIKSEKEESSWRCPPIWLTFIVAIIILLLIYLPYSKKLTQDAMPATKTLQSLMKTDVGKHEN